MAERGPSGPVPITRGLNCPVCGAALTLRAAGHSLTVVCDSCFSVLDAKDPNYQVLSKFQAKQKWTPKIPLGTRGTLDSVIHEVIGMQVRTISVEGVSYSWTEYLLFNPYQGFRYLTEYNGHWNYVKTVPSIPQPARSGAKPAVKFQGETFAHFQTSRPRTSFVLGEFPWQVRAGDTAQARDYICPPRILSSESTEQETTWSLGEYMTGDQVWGAFKLSGKAPRAAGIFANQPSPYETQVKQVWRLWAVGMAAIVAMALFFAAFTRHEVVFAKDYAYTGGRGEAVFVTEVFDLKGRISDVELATHTTLYNNWAYFNFALINDDTGQAFDFGREVSFYHDSDGDEGSQSDEVLVPAVPSGRYYLRVEPEVPAGAPAFTYDLRVRRDVPVSLFYWIVAILLTLPPVFVTLRSFTFEGRRWQESDYASSVSSSSSGDDD